nr:hypothetical protein [Tanacetum cinerariifolium]
MPKVLSLAWETILKIKLAFEDKHCQPEDILELFRRLHNDVQNIHEELAMYINTPNWDRPTVCYDDDDEDYAIASSVENLVPILSESDGILDNMCDMPFYDNSSPLDVSKDQFEEFFDSNDGSTLYDDDSFSIDNIEYVKASPPHSELVSLESSSTSLNSLLEETNTFDNSLPEFEVFCFDLEEISSGSTTTRSDICLPEYEAFYYDHVKEISSGSTTTHFDSSLYDSFIFDLSINPFPPTDRSDFYEFVDELAYIIPPPEYDCFCFKNEPNSGDFIMNVVEDTFPTREPRPGHLAARLGCAEMKVATWDDLAFKLITLRLRLAQASILKEVLEGVEGEGVGRDEVAMSKGGATVDPRGGGDIPEKHKSGGIKELFS